jgi:hypothetical protein
MQNSISFSLDSSPREEASRRRWRRAWASVASRPSPVRSTGPASRLPPSTEASPSGSPPLSPSPPLSGSPPLSPFVPPSGSPHPSASVRVAASIRLCLHYRRLHLTPSGSPPPSMPLSGSPSPSASVRTVAASIRLRLHRRRCRCAKREHAVVGVDAAASVESGAAQYEALQLGHPPAGQRHRRLLLHIYATRGRAVQQHMVVAARGSPPRRCLSCCTATPHSPAASLNLCLTGLDLGS